MLTKECKKFADIPQKPGEGEGDRGSPLDTERAQHIQHLGFR